MLKGIRVAIGNRELRLDSNGSWTVPTAREALRRVAPFNMSWFEEQVEFYDGGAFPSGVKGEGFGGRFLKR